MNGIIIIVVLCCRYYSTFRCLDDAVVIVRKMDTDFCLNQAVTH